MITGGSSGIGAELARACSPATAGGASSSRAARSGCGSWRPRSAPRPRSATSATGPAVDALAARVTDAPPADRAARQQRRHPRPRRLPRRRPRADRERDARQLLRRRLVPARVPAGARGRRSRRTSSTSSRSQERSRSRPSGPYAASKHAQLAFSRAVAAQLRAPRHPGAHRPARLRRDGRASRSRACSRRRSSGRSSSPTGSPARSSGAIRPRPPRELRPLVVPPRRGRSRPPCPSLVARVLARGRYGGPGAA